MRKEQTILLEPNSEKRLSLIGESARWVGNLMRCPKCRAWLFLKPQRGKLSPAILLKAAPFTKADPSPGRRKIAAIRSRKPVVRHRRKAMPSRGRTAGI